MNNSELLLEAVFQINNQNQSLPNCYGVVVSEFPPAAIPGYIRMQKKHINSTSERRHRHNFLGTKSK